MPNPFIPLLPSLPTQPKVIMEDGSWNHEWKLYLAALDTALRTMLSNTGLRIPKQTSVNISNLDPSDPNTFGATLYDTDNHLAKININGTFKTITTS